MKKKIFTAIGLMSGTSMDGIDLSLIKSDGYTEFSSILDNYFEFDKSLQNGLINLRNKLFTHTDLDKYSEEIKELEKQFTLFNGEIINEFLKKYGAEIDLIGFHGQTVFHDVNKKISVQLGDGKLLSQITQKIVVNNFRQEDLNNGGQGAPLVPIFHQLISESLTKNYNLKLPINIINIGGISNITQIISNDKTSNLNLKACDIGPGNCLIDEWVRKNSTKKIDKSGEIAKSGNINDLILNQSLENFSIDTYEKSLDTKDFDISFAKGLSLEDGCATITKFTAYLIAKGVEYLNSLNHLTISKNLVCGGGRKNNFLIETINKYLDEKKIRLEKIDRYGLNGDFIESQAFGFLSIRSFLKLPISFPSTTRCNTPTTGGTVNKNF